MKRLVATLVAIGLALSTAACGGSESSDDPSGQASEELTIVFPAPSALYWGTYVAIDKGFFQEEGFRPTIVAAQSSAAALQQLASGSAQLSSGAPEAVINAVSAGAKIKMISQGAKFTVGTLIGARDIKSYDQLKGKKIGVSALKGGEITWIRMLLTQNGVSPDDVTFLVAGTAQARLAGIEAGSLAAGIVFPPTDFAQLAKGLTRLGSILDVPLSRQLPYVAYNVEASWASESDRVPRLRRVFEKANTWLHDDKNKDEAVRILATSTKQDASYVEQTYRDWFVDNDLWVRGDGQMTDAQFETALKIMEDNDLLTGPKPALSDLRL